MPTYHVHDTTVKLCVWDPAQAPRLSNNQETPYKSDPACRHDTEPLKEEYFEGQEGVQFLGSSMPFFLVNAGRDLFFETCHNPRVITKAEHPLDQTQAEQYSDEDDLNLSNFPPTTPSKAFEKSTDVFNDPEDDSGLSSIPSSIFAESTPPGIEDSASQNESSRARKKPRGWLHLPLKHQRQMQNAVSKPITSAKPIKIQIDLSKKSFMKSLYANNAQDICVNIFYNGEFAHSKVLRSRSATSYTAEEKEKHFCGRRIDNNNEIPWVVLPLIKDDDSIAGMPDESSSFEDRWNRVNQLLVTEAEEWGQTGKYDMFRAPVGEYLEELSKKAIPENMKNQGVMGDKAGIIDVVITVGSATTITQWANLMKPRRKLPKDFCGKPRKLYIVPEELNPRRRAQIVADFEREEMVKSASRSITKQITPTPSIEDEGYFRTRAITTKVPLNESIDESALMATESSKSHFSETEEQDRLSEPRCWSQDTFPDNCSMQIMDGSSSHQPLSSIMPPSRSLRGGSLPVMSSSPPMSKMLGRTRTHSTTMPAIHANERSPHPTRPSPTPQKSYKGPSPSFKQQKVENPWEFLPFDAEKPVSHSTRSKRSTAKLLLTPENVRGQELVDSYLTLRNRQLGSLSSVDFERSPHLTVHQDGMTSPSGVNFEIDSSPCEPPIKSNRICESSFRSYEDRDVYMDIGFGMEDTGDVNFDRTDLCMSFEGTPTRSLKRKWPSTGSPNRPLDDGEDSSIEASKSFERFNVVSKVTTGSGNTVAIIELEDHVAGRTVNTPIGTPTGVQQKPMPNQGEEETHTRQRRPSRAMSVREPSGLLTPHKHAMGVNTSFRKSFADSGSIRSIRDQLTNQENTRSVIEAETSQVGTKVTAIFKKRLIIIKGLKGMGDTTPKQARTTEEIEATESDAIAPAPRIEYGKDMEKIPSAFVGTTQLEAPIKSPKPNTSNCKLSTIPKQTTKPVGFARTTSPVAPSLIESKKGTKLSNSKAALAGITRPESNISKNIKQSKGNNSKEGLAEKTRSEAPQIRNIKQAKVKNLTQELGAASTSISMTQVVKPHEKAKTEKLPELARTSKAEPATPKPANAEKIRVSSPQELNLIEQPECMKAPLEKALERRKQPTALLQASDLDSGAWPNMAQNSTTASSVKEVKISSGLTTEFNLVQITTETMNIPEGKIVTTTSETKFQSAPQRGKENVEKTAVQFSTSKKPNLVINQGIANVRSFRSYSTTSQGIKTPTPRSGTFATTKYTRNPVALTRTRPSSISIKVTPGTASPTVREKVPTFALHDSQESNKPRKQARSRPPPVDLISISNTVPSVSTENTAMTMLTGGLNSTIKDSPPSSSSASVDSPWKPNSLCTGSVLSYATAQIAAGWSKEEYNSRGDSVSRSTMMEREAVFRANGILMGVRFVLGVGCNENGVDVGMKG